MSDYEKSDQHYDPKGTDTLSNLCACMGRVHGEPFCPCEMARRGLPLSKDHAEAQEKSKAEFDAFLRKYGWK